MSLAETGVTGNIRSGKRIHIGNALTGVQAPLEAPTVLSFTLGEAPREVILNWEYQAPEGLLGFDVALFRPAETEDNEPTLLVETDVDATARTLTLDANQTSGAVYAALRARSATGAVSGWAESPPLDLTDTTSPPQVVDLTASASTALDLGYTIRSTSGEMGDSWQVENLQTRPPAAPGPPHHGIRRIPRG